MERSVSELSVFGIIGVRLGLSLSARVMSPSV
jgi:hypothetical protein